MSKKYEESQGAYPGTYPGEVVHPESDTEYWDVIRANAQGVNDIQRVFIEQPSSVIVENQVRATDIQNVIPLQEDVTATRLAKERSIHAARAARAEKRELKHKKEDEKTEDGKDGKDSEDS